MSVSSKMTAIANAIRGKTGGSALLTLDGMATAIAGISTGGGGERFAGSFTTNASYKATVSCGFKPDVVMIFTPSFSYNSSTTCEANLKYFFAEKKMSYSEISNARYDDGIYEGIAVRTETGFEISMMGYSFSWSKKPSIVSSKTFQYVAVKYKA